MREAEIRKALERCLTAMEMPDPDRTLGRWAWREIIRQGRAALEPLPVHYVGRELDIQTRFVVSKMNVPYSPATLPAACAAFTGTQEGRISWMYLDGTGNVTVGCGHLLKNATDAAQVFGVDISVIQPEFDRVAAMESGGTSVYYSTASTHRLFDDQIDALLASDLSRFIADCQRYINDFWSIPGPVQVAAVDLAFNTGSLSHWPKFCGEVNAGDWALAAAQSNRPQLPARSTAVRNLILSVV